jgi:transposase-like protein
MSHSFLLKWRLFAAEVTLCSVDWYLRWALSYREVEKLMQEHGLGG